MLVKLNYQGHSVEADLNDFALFHELVHSIIELLDLDPSCHYTLRSKKTFQMIETKEELMGLGDDEVFVVQLPKRKANDFLDQLAQSRLTLQTWCDTLEYHKQDKDFLESMRKNRGFLLCQSFIVSVEREHLSKALQSFCYFFTLDMPLSFTKEFVQFVNEFNLVGRSQAAMLDFTALRSNSTCVDALTETFSNLLSAYRRR